LYVLLSTPLAEIFLRGVGVQTQSMSCTSDWNFLVNTHSWNLFKD